MPCACKGKDRGFTRGTVTGYVVLVQGEPAVMFDGVPLVWADEESGDNAARDAGYTEWALEPVTV